MDGFSNNRPWLPAHAQGYQESVETPEVTSARNTMIESLARLSNQLRASADVCDNFVRTMNSNAQAIQAARGAGTEQQPSFLPLGITPPAAPASAQTTRQQQDSPQSTAELDANAKKISKRAKKLAKQAMDPDAPKRPASAYIEFQNEVREDMRKRHPELSYKEVMSKISDSWKALTEDERKVYQDKTNEKMKNWAEEKKGHEATRLADQSTADEDAVASNLPNEQPSSNASKPAPAPAAAAATPTAADTTTGSATPKKRKLKESKESKESRKSRS